jgi:hypothetical protein
VRMCGVLCSRLVTRAPLQACIPSYAERAVHLCAMRALRMLRHLRFHGLPPSETPLSSCRGGAQSVHAHARRKEQSHGGGGGKGCSMRVVAVDAYDSAGQCPATLLQARTWRDRSEWCRLKGLGTQTARHTEP